MHNGLHQLVEAIGLESALRIIVAWGGTTLYVPDRYDPDHLISKVLGEDAAIQFELTYGGQTLSVPKLSLHHIKLEVNVVKLIAKGFSPREAGHILGISKERAKQIANKHRNTCKTAPKKNHQKKIGGDPGDRIDRGAADPRKSASAKTGQTSYQAAGSTIVEGVRGE